VKTISARDVERGETVQGGDSFEVSGSQIRITGGSNDSEDKDCRPSSLGFTGFTGETARE
jgi:hypothetical protein